MRAGLLDFIDTPAQGNKLIPGVTWCADNGCFGKGYPGDTAWFGWLQRQASDVATCAFAVAPDVVGDAEATLERSTPWLEPIRQLGYPVAFVAQNGIENTVIPWAKIDVIFLGGSAECVRCVWVRPADDRDTKRCPGCHRRLVEWKLGSIARRLTAEAKARGKWVHMGRVNSAKRFHYASLIGCDSADGTYIAKGPDINLPKMLRWLDESDQLPLFGSVA
jgi:hypothetical protein